MNPEQRNIADSVAGLIKDGLVPTAVAISRGNHSSNNVLLVPAGMKEIDLKAILDRYLPAPERRKGATSHTDLNSFIAWVNRFKSAPTVIFAKDAMDAPGMTAIFNHNPEGDDEKAAGWGDHRAQYTFPLSKEWQAWLENDGEGMNQGDFAAFIEERLVDIRPARMELDGRTGETRMILSPTVEAFVKESGVRIATVQQMMSLSRGLDIHSNDKITNRVNLQSGESTLVYDTEHRDGSGAKVDVPGLFLIGIPVFDHGAVYELGARLRYRIVNGLILWTYHLLRADVSFNDAFGDAIQKTRNETGLPVFLGTP